MIGGEFNMDRPTDELVLPNSQAKLVFYQKLQLFESRQVQKKLLEYMKIKVTDDAEEMEKAIKDLTLPASAMLELQEVALGFLLKEIYAQDGTKVTNHREFLNGLDETDADALFAKIDQLTNKSNLSPEAKKK